MNLLTKLMGRVYMAPLDESGEFGGAALDSPVTTPDTGTAPSGISEKDIKDLLDHDDIDKGDSPMSPVTTQPASPQAPAASVLAPPAQPVAPIETVVAPAVPAVSTPPTPAAPVTPPVETPAAPVPAPAPVAPTPAVPEQTEAQKTAEWTKRRADFTTTLEKAYAIPEDRLAEVNVNPAVELPKLAARLHLEVLESATAGLAALLPQAIATALHHQSTVTKTENEFYAMWPQLDRGNANHEATARNLLTTIVQGNPRISKADAMKQAGAATMIALGIPYEKAGVVAAPVAPAMPATFSPAAPGAGGTGTPGRTGGLLNPFDQLSREMEEDLR